MKELIAMAALILSAGPAHSGTFCENSPFVSFNELIRGAKAFEGKRVQTHVVLKTDAKEYTLITQDDKATVGASLDSDAISEAYVRKHNVHLGNRSDLLTDFWSKLRAARGANAPLDMSQLANYRQELLLCGRLSRSYVGYKFTVDDSILEKSYLLPGGRRK